MVQIGGTSLTLWVIDTLFVAACLLLIVYGSRVVLPDGAARA